MSRRTDHHALPSSSQAKTPTRLVVGFGVVLGLMTYVIGVGLVGMDENRARTRALVEGTLVKYTLVTQMRQASRERTFALQRMVLSDDPFERDSEFLRFNALGTEFAVARQGLTAFALGEEERAILEAQSTATRYSIPIQEAVIELAASGGLVEARRLLNEEAVPAQERVYETLVELYRLQEQAAARLAEETDHSYYDAREWILAVAALALVLGLLVAIVVVRRSREAEHSLFEAKEQAQVTLQSIAEAVVTTDSQGRVTYLNPSAEALTGWAHEAARDHPVQSVLNLRRDGASADEEAPLEALLRAEAGVDIPQDLILVRSTGGQSAVELTTEPMRGRGGETIGRVIVVRDVTEVRALGRELTYQASHDHLTGLLNRRAFEQLLGNALERARGEGLDHAICYIDLDLFKVVNDSSGHAAGDELLRQIAEVLRARLRRHDVLARLGGDEFGVLLTGCDVAKAAQIAESLRDAVVAYRFAWEDKLHQVSASVGVAPISAASGDLSDVMRAVDLACYSAKESGRNAVRVATPGDQELAARQGEIDWVARLRHALKEDRFALFGQEIRTLAGRTRGLHCEVLVRMRDEEGDLVSPAAFLPAAERFRLMPELDRWVITQTLRLLAPLQGRAGIEDCVVNLNISGQTLGDRGVLDFVVDAISSSGVAPGCLCFEITETAAIGNLTAAMRVMGVLRGMGCRFALDDFGSGLSSFAYLKNLPVDYLKIDGAFIRGLAVDPADRAMVASINEVAHALGIRTIGECVENEEVRAELKRMAVDCAQGYHIARPEPLQALVARRCFDDGA